MAEFFAKKRASTLLRFLEPAADKTTIVNTIILYHESFAQVEWYAENVAFPVHLWPEI